ncbi:dihydroorotate dehydrogenase [Roseimaritima ulvae]|uniref:Dihydroorotate dehydrogenase n=1 Tax=Roseimaritima ulvae TaxID=980254 RepID=A0A5B9QS00_9BACT|nr:dihydroorotate dehydrogenase [Roseimaritima ulvae]QEG40732.1 Dihydroorotate dehydrogenase B (NAD(+)), catalytic subunit [Roseimaritima ulvae]
MRYLTGPHLRYPFRFIFVPRWAAVSALTVSLNRLNLQNPILVASGTFGYAREMEGLVDCARLGGILPKTITAEPRIGNAPWRTVEVSAGLLNSIGLDNDGVDAFLQHHLPYLSKIGTAIIVSVAGRSEQEYVQLAERVGSQSGVAAIELNLSCPNVSGGVDFGTDPAACGRLVAAARAACPVPILAKLTPNVTRIVDVASAAADAGADAVCLINTLLGMAVDWRKRRPMLGNVMGGLSGPAIKPVALRCVHQVRQATSVPIIGIGGIATIDDVMEFLVAGASAVQIGTANYYDPHVSTRLIDELPAALELLGADSVKAVVGTLNLDRS